MSRSLTEGRSDLDPSEAGAPNLPVQPLGVGTSSSSLGWIGVALALMLVGTWAASDATAPVSVAATDQGVAMSAPSAVSADAPASAAAVAPPATQAVADAPSIAVAPFPPLMNF